MSATEPPRLNDDLRAAFHLQRGLVARCRDAVQAGSAIKGLSASRLALEELGYDPRAGTSQVLAAEAAEHLQRIVELLVAGQTTERSGDLWTLPVAAGTSSTVALDALSAQQRARAGWLELLGMWLTGRFPDEHRRLEMPVLTRRGDSGEVSQLCLRTLKAGPPGLYPHPTMALFYGDEQFGQAVADAWQAVKPQARTVTWELRNGDLALDHVVGASAGGAFAVALTHLERHAASRRARLLGVRGGAAVSARVHPDGSLGDVEGQQVKLKAAAQAGLRTVVVAAEKGAGQPERVHDKLQVRYASSVEEAARYTRSISAASVAVVLVLVLALSAAGTLAVANHRSAERNRRERLSRVADELLSQAGRAGRDDLQLQQRLLLAASSVARSADNRVLAKTAINRSASVQPGVLERLDLSVAGSVDGLVPVDDGHSVIAWSESGHLALFDGSSGRPQGTFVQPPGVLSLVQTIPVASAALSRTGLVAFVFQDPVKNFSGADHRASLVILSTSGPLHVVGRVPNFTTVPVGAIGYGPSGTRLLTVSSTDLAFWDTTRPTPSGEHACHWRPHGVTGEPVALITLPGGRPGLMLDQGQLLRLHGWTPTSKQTCPGRLIAPALPDVRAEDFTRHLLALGKDSQSRPVQFGLRRDGRLDVRPLGAPLRVRDIGPNATEIGTPADGQLPVQFGRDDSISLTTFKVTGTRLKPASRFRRHGLPAAQSNGFTYAVQDGRVSQLSSEGQTYPPATTELGHSGQLVNAIQITDRAVAIGYPGSAAIIGLRDARLDRVVTWPQGAEIAPADGRLNETFSLSASGRYLAAVLGGKNAPRRLALFDAHQHAEIDVSAQLRRYSTLAPLDIAFERGSDRLLVEYLNGLLLRLSPSKAGWTSQALLRGVVHQQALGLTLSDSQLFRIEANENRARVASYDLQGRPKTSWSLASTGLRFGFGDQASQAQLSVMSDSRAALVLNSGSVYPLLGGGRLGRPIALGDSPVFESAQIGPQDMLFAMRSGTATLHWDSGVVENSTQRYGPLAALGVSPRFDLLAGSIWLYGTSVVMPLQSDAQTAVMCDAADGDLPASAWRRFVGADVPYRPLCKSFRSQGNEVGFLAFRSRRLPEPAGVRTPTLAEARALRAPCGAQRHARPSPVRSGPDDFTVCANGRAIWLSSGLRDLRAQPGSTSRRPLLLISGTVRDTRAHGAQISELIDGQGNAVAEFFVRGGTASLVGDKVAVTEQVGNLLVTTTYGPDRRGAGWTALQQLPVGTARMPTDG